MRSFYSSVISVFEKSRAALAAALLGLLMAISGNPAEAADPRADFQAAMFAYSRGDFDLAIQLFNSALQAPALDNKSQATILNGRSRAFVMSGDANSANNDANQSISLDPNSQANFRRLTRYQRFHSSHHPTQNLDQVIAFETGTPALVRALIYRGDRYADLGDHRRAIGDYDAALALDPDNILALDGREAALAELGLAVQSTN